jgi:dihydroorotase
MHVARHDGKAMSNIEIINGTLISPSEQKPRKGNLYIADGIIVAQNKAPAEFTADITLDAKQHWVCPGLIDLSAHLGEPGFEYKTTIAQETWAAAQRGITTLCYPPNTAPVIDNAEVALAIQHRALQTNQSRVVTLGALTQNLAGLQLAPMGALKQAGCVGVSNGKRPITDTRVLYNALAYAATFDLTVLLYANDPWLIQNGCAHDGSVSARLGLRAIPTAAETIGVSQAIQLQKATGVKLHLCRISCAESVTLIAEAQMRGQAITADVAIHHLFLSDLDIDGFNNNCNVQPPLRSVADQQGLLQGIQEGVITAICSDHEPHESAAKLQPFPSSAPGISGLDTLLSLVLALQDKLSLTPNQLISLVTANPAAILNLPLGSLNSNMPADICIINPDVNWTLTKENILSRGKNTPFIGWPLQGEVQTTIVGGEMVYHKNY